MLPGQSLHILGCGIEKLVGQVSQGPGDRPWGDRRSPMHGRRGARCVGATDHGATAGRPERQRYAETARLATDCVTSFIAFARSSSWASNGAGAPSRRTDSSTAAEANTCCAARFPATPLSR